MLNHRTGSRPDRYSPGDQIMLKKRILVTVVSLLFVLNMPPVRADQADSLDQQLGLTRESGSLPLWTEPDSRAAHQLGQIIRDMQESVMIVGHPQVGIGTAFVLSEKDRLLATNAHVADMYHRAAGHMEAIAGKNGRRYRIDRVWYHPGVVRQSESEEGKLIRSTDARAGNVHPHCPDVAILHVADGPPLPPALLLATPDELESLFAQPIGILGYPGFDSKFPRTGQVPQPTYHQGVISRMTDFTLTPTQEDARRQFVQHTASGWWGFSGSPVFLANGHVAAVHNSYRTYDRKPLYVNLSHAVRVDCLWELLAYHNLGTATKTTVPVAKEKLELDRFAGRDPEFEQIREAARLVREGKELVYQANYGAAVKRSYDAMKIVPDYSDAWYLKYACHTGYLARFGRRVSPDLRLEQAEAAFEAARKIVQLTPADPMAVLAFALAAANLAQSQVEAGMPEDKVNAHRTRALELVERILATVNLTPAQKTEAYNVRGALHKGLGDYHAALADFSKALQLDPEYMAGYRNRARVLGRLGRKDEATADMKKAEELRIAKARTVAPTWKAFVSEKCGFRAEFPYPPVEFLVTQKADIEIWRFLCLDKRTELNYVIFGMNLPDDVVGSKASVDRILDVFLKVGMEQGTLVEQSDVSLGSYPGKALVVAMPGGDRALARLYCVGNWAYPCVVRGPADRFESCSDDVARFFDSFAVRPQNTPEPKATPVPPVVDVSPPDADVAKGWKQIVRPEDGFQIAFPGEPEVATKNIPGGGRHTQYAYLNKALGVPFVFTMMDVNDAQKKQWPKAEQQLDGVRDMLTRKDKLIGEEAIQLDGHSGRILRIESAPGKLITVRVFAANGRIYQCLSGGTEAAMRQHADMIDTFFKSFRLIGKQRPVEHERQLAWKEYLLEEHGFRVEFPGEPSHDTSESPSGAIYNQFLFGDDPVKVLYAVIYNDFTPEQQVAFPTAAKRLEESRKRVVGESQVRREEEIKQNGFSGREVELANPEGTITCSRMFVVNDRLYQCSVVAPAERFASERRNIDRFLKSFHLLTPVASDEPPAVTEQPQPPKQLLTLCDIEACYGSLGPVRQSPAYYPYDSIEFRAGVEGATGDDDGKAKISWIIELIGPDGKKVVEDKGEGRTGLARYNNRLPFFVTLPLPAEPPPGDYTFRVIVRDDLAERETSFEQPIEIRPAEFAIVSPHFFYDEEGKAPARAGGTVGQVLFVRLQCIGFDKSSGRIETAMSIQLLDEKERPVLPKAVEAVVREDKADVVKEADVVTFSGHIPLEVAGKFTLRVVLQDLVGNNLATYTAPIEVTPISR